MPKTMHEKEFETLRAQIEQQKKSAANRKQQFKELNLDFSEISQFSDEEFLMILELIPKKVEELIFEQIDIRTLQDITWIEFIKMLPRTLDSFTMYSFMPTNKIVLYLKHYPLHYMNANEIKKFTGDDDTSPVLNSVAHTIDLRASKDIGGSRISSAKTDDQIVEILFSKKNIQYLKIDWDSSWVRFFDILCENKNILKLEVVGQCAQYFLKTEATKKDWSPNYIYTKLYQKDHVRLHHCIKRNNNIIQSFTQFASIRFRDNDTMIDGRPAISFLDDLMIRTVGEWLGLSEKQINEALHISNTRRMAQLRMLHAATFFQPRIETSVATSATSSELTIAKPEAEESCLFRS